MLKWDKSKAFKDIHPSNIPVKQITFSVRGKDTSVVYVEVDGQIWRKYEIDFVNKQVRFTAGSYIPPVQQPTEPPTSFVPVTPSEEPTEEPYEEPTEEPYEEPTTEEPVIPDNATENTED